MKILIINGPNLNFLGLREPHIYGTQTLNDLENLIKDYSQDKNIKVDFFQSNHEGAIIDAIQNAYQKVDAIIINPAAYTHTSIAIADALKAVNIPAIEVHLSDLSNREAYRQISYIRDYCLKTFSGLGFDGYLRAIDYLIVNGL